MLQILRKEVNAFFNSLVGYVVMVVFLTVTGLFLWVFPQTSVFDYGFASIDPLFQIAPYVFLFLIPAVTMRTFAEERKAGTMELLLTRPLTDAQIVLGKYLSSLLLTVFALLPTLLYYYTVYELGDPVGNVDSAAVIGSYVGLLCLAATFTAIGLFASALTDNQIVAFVLSIFLCFVMYEGFASLASLSAFSAISYRIGQLGVDYHYASMSKGLIDSRNLVYFLSVSTLFLLATRLTLASRKW